MQVDLIAACAKWWPDRIEDVFARSPIGSLRRNLGYVTQISEVMRRDEAWLSVSQGQRVYAAARHWAASGAWDQILVLLVQDGKTEEWPARSRRWGAEAFNNWGLPRTGLFSIVTLRQARAYRDGLDPRSVPFAIKGTFTQASTWRTQMPKRSGATGAQRR